MALYNLENFLQPFFDLLWPLRAICLAVSVTFLLFIGYSAWKTHWFKFVIAYAWVEFFDLRPWGQAKAARQWHHLRHRFARPDHRADYRSALIEARAILDDFLDDIVIFFQTTTLEKRLEHLGEATISNIDDLRQTVAFTDEFLSDPSKTITEAEAMPHLEIYHRAFVDLGVAE